MGATGTIPIQIQDPPLTTDVEKLTSGTIGIWKATLPAINHRSGVDETDRQAGRMDCVGSGYHYIG